MLTHNILFFTEIPGPTRRVFPSRYDEEDYVEQYGSAEQEEDEEQPNILIQRGSPNLVTQTMGPPALGTHHTYLENQVPMPPARGGSPRSSNRAFKPRLRCHVWIFGILTIVLNSVR